MNSYFLQLGVMDNGAVYSSAQHKPYGGIVLMWRPAGTASLRTVRMIQTWVSSGLFVRGSEPV